MKTSVRFLLFCFLFATNLYAQNGVSAEIFFSLSYQGFLKEDVQEMPKQVTYFVSGNNSKQVVQTSVSTMTVIANADSVFLANLNDVDDDRTALVYDREDIENSLSAFRIKIKKRNETKKISGYLCQKYDISITNLESKEKMKDEVFVTEQLGGENANFFLYKELKGFILWSQKTQGNEIVTMQAKRVVKKDFPVETFLIPEEYTITTYKDQVKQDD